MEEEKQQAPVHPVSSVDSMPEWAKGLVEQMAKLSEENTMLKEMAGRNAIASFVDAKRDFTLKKVHFKKINNKIVVGWENLDSSKFVFDLKDPVKENLKMTLIFKDYKETEIIDYIRFIRNNDLVFANLIKFSPFGKSVVEFENGEKMEVDTKFLNA